MSSKRSIHVYNLANVAYGYSKIFAKYNQNPKLITHDTLHLMSQPEWDDLDLDSEQFHDENNFFDNSADLSTYNRPDWFNHTSIFPSPKPEIAPKITVEPKVLSTDERIAHFLRLYWAKVPGPVKVITAPTLRYLYYNQLASRSKGPAACSKDEWRDLKSRIVELSNLSRKYGDSWEVSSRSLMPYLYHALWLERHSKPEDVIFSYVLSPIYSMVLGDRPFISVEIGTLRDIPFDNSDTGKMLALAYRLSDHVLITNPDVKNQADQLGLESYSFCPHPIDEEIYGPSYNDSSYLELRHRILQEYDASSIIFAPARQNWEVKGNDLYLKAFSEFVKSGRKSVLIIPGWGQEIKESKAFIKTLGIEAYVKWIKPQSERSLAKYYQASDFVLDQFVLGVFGLTSPKALASGKPVLTSYNEAYHDWCFSEHPPVLKCESAKEIYENLVHYSDNRDKLDEISQKSKQWVKNFHSNSLIIDRLSTAMDIATDRFSRRTWDVIRKN